MQRYINELISLTIKRTLKIAAWVVGSLGTIALLVFLLIRASGFQTWVVNSFAEKIEENYGGFLEVGKVKARYPKSLVLYDVLFKDQLGDTLAFIPEVSAGIKKLDFENISIELRKVRIKEPYFQLLEDPGGGYNFDFFIHMVTPKDSIPPPFFVSAPLVSIKNGIVRFKNFGAVSVENEFNYNDIKLSKLDLSLFNFNLSRDSIMFRLRNFAFQERSGFVLHDADGNVQIKNNTLILDYLNLESESSSISLSDLEFNLPDFALIDESTNPVDYLDASFRINSDGIISNTDIAYFYRKDSVSLDQIRLKGEFDISPYGWNINNSELDIGDWLHLNGSAYVDNPKDFKKSDLNLILDTLWFDSDKALSSYPALFFNPDTISIRLDPKDLGRVRMKANISGNQDDFMADCELITGIGVFDGHLMVSPDDETGLLNIYADYHGSIMHLDSYLNLNTGLGLISSDGQFQGVWDGDSLYNIRLEAELPYLQWNNYYYTDVGFNAVFRHKVFETEIFVEDDNGKMDFSAHFDLRDEEPLFDFDVHIAEAQLFKLNLYKPDSIAWLDLNLHASFAGKELDDIDGQLWVENSRFENSRGEIPVKELNLEVTEDFNGKKIVLVSDYIDGRMSGDIFLDDLPGQLSSLAARFLPLSLEPTIIHPNRLNDFIFNINFKNPRLLAEVLASEFIFKENTQLSGFFKYGGQELDIEGNSPQFILNRKQFTGLNFSVQAAGNDLILAANLEKLELDKSNVFNNISINATMLPDLMETRLSWQEQDSIRYISEINPSLSFEKGVGTFPRMIIEMPNSTVFFKEKQWEIGDSRFEIDNKFFGINDLMLTSMGEELFVNGNISDVPGDTLELNFKSLDLAVVNDITKNEQLEISGFLNGQAQFFNFYDGGLFLADMAIDDFAVNGEKVGLTEIKSRREFGSDDVLINLLTKRGDLSTLNVNGRYSPKTDNIDFLLSLDKLRLNILEPFLYPSFREINGIASGDIEITGTRNNPLLNGVINIQKGAFRVDYLNTRYTFTHPVIVNENGIRLENLHARDELGNEAVVNGGVSHKSFRDPRVDINIDTRNLMLMNTSEINGNGYWGKLFGTGNVRISGPTDLLKIDVSAAVTGNSRFSLPISDESEARDVDFITYVVREVKDDDPDLISFADDGKKSGYNADLNNLEVHLDIDVTPSAEVRLIFDAKVGDVLSGRGSGNLQLDVDTRGRFSLNGDYNIDEGEYLFTIQNIPLKRFAIQSGSSIKFTGNPEDAQLNIDAVYNTRAALYDLLQEETEELTERVPVTCHLLMNGVLESPDLSFAINLPPNSDDMARSQLESLTDDELQKQLFSLLVLNRFQPLPGLSNSPNSRSYGNAGLATTTAVLSSQFNYWLSQISNDFDIGFDYRPGDQITSDEVEVALSTQIFNNRMKINLNGNVDMRSSQEETNQLVGDVEVEYKIRPSGKVRVKAFNRSNDKLIYEYSPYTQGVGVFFREEFDTFGELLKRYWQGIFNNTKTGNQ